MSVFHHGHKGLPIVTVSEETGDDNNKEFVGELLGEAGDVGDTVWVRVNVTDADNTFGWSQGVSLQQLKHLGDGKYGA